MVHAYVMMEVRQSKVQKVLNAMAQMPFVKDLDAITGNFDVIAKIEGLDQNDLGQISTRELTVLDGVERTITYPVIEF